MTNETKRQATARYLRQSQLDAVRNRGEQLGKMVADLEKMPGVNVDLNVEDTIDEASRDLRDAFWDGYRRAIGADGPEAPVRPTEGHE